MSVGGSGDQCAPISPDALYPSRLAEATCLIPDTDADEDALSCEAKIPPSSIPSLSAHSEMNSPFII